MIGDIKVVGLVMGTHVIEDIGMDVPHGIAVNIPAHLAYASKDLWRAISQRLIFQLHSGPVGGSVTRPPDNTAEMEALRERIRALEAENVRLQGLLAVKEAANQSSKLDSILALLQSGGVQPQRVVSTASGVRPSVGVVEEDVPMFIPSTIKPDGVDVQITTPAEESAGAGVSDAASALRKLRRGQ